MNKFKFIISAIALAAIIVSSLTSCYNRHNVNKLRCYGVSYNPETHFCYDAIAVYAKCNAREYNPSTEECKVISKISDSTTIECDNLNIRYDTLIDGRDGQKYKTVKIGNQTWMAENLNYNASNSKCHNNDPANCAKYGKLYDLVTALVLPDSCYSSVCDVSQVKNKGICPEGWHIPSKAEWGELHDFIVVEQPEIIKALIDLYGDTIMTVIIDPRYTEFLTFKGSLIAKAIKLKSKCGWDKRFNGSSGNGTNDYGFSALPSIWHKKLDGSLQEGHTSWWMTSDDSVTCLPRMTCTHIYSIASYWNDIFQYMAVNNGQGGKEDDASVRCMKD